MASQLLYHMHGTQQKSCKSKVRVLKRVDFLCVRTCTMLYWLHGTKNCSVDGAAPDSGHDQTEQIHAFAGGCVGKVCPHQSLEKAQFPFATGFGAPNVIPDAVELSGTVRALTTEHFERLKSRIAQVCTPTMCGLLPPSLVHAHEQWNLKPCVTLSWSPPALSCTL